MGRNLSIEKNKNILSLIVDSKECCTKIKETDASIARLKKKIEEVGQDDPKLAYYEYTCSEFEAEKCKLVNSFQNTFKEIRVYSEELQENYDRLQKHIELKKIMTRYCTRTLKDNSNFNCFRKDYLHSADKDLQKMLKEKDELALKMQQISPIIDTLDLL